MTNKMKDLTVLIEQAKDQGWVITPTKNGHYKWVSPTGSLFFSSSTPSDGNAIHQVRRDLARRGCIIIAKKKKGGRNS
jgi:hypothetical protein